jgi:hypothetical protein
LLYQENSMQDLVDRTRTPVQVQLPSLHVDFCIVIILTHFLQAKMNGLS